MKSCVPYYTTIHTSGVTLSAPCSPSSQGAKFTEVRLFAVLVPPYTVTWGLHVAGPNVCSTCAVSNVAHCCHICPYRLLSEALRVPFSLTCSAAGFSTGSMFMPTRQASSCIAAISVYAFQRSISSLTFSCVARSSTC